MSRSKANSVYGVRGNTLPQDGCDTLGPIRTRGKRSVQGGESLAGSGQLPAESGPKTGTSQDSQSTADGLDDLEIVGTSQPDTVTGNRQRFQQLKKAFSEKFGKLVLPTSENSQTPVANKDSIQPPSVVKKKISDEGLTVTVNEGLNGSLLFEKPFYGTAVAYVKVQLGGVIELYNNVYLIENVYRLISRAAAPKDLKVALGDNVSFFLSPRYSNHAYLTDWARKGTTTAKIVLSDCEIEDFISFIKDNLVQHFPGLSG